jgi:hypothetical protein
MVAPQNWLCARHHRLWVAACGERHLGIETGGIRDHPEAAAAAAATPGSMGRRIALGRRISGMRDSPGRSGHGKVLRIIQSNRFVTGVTWIDGELWHRTWEGDESDVRRIDPHTGETLERLEMPPGTGVSGLEANGDQFFWGGGNSGKVRAVRRPRREVRQGAGAISEFWI